MADFGKLRVAGKGDPPAAEVGGTGNLKQPPREGEEKARLEFSVPESVADAFADEAARLFGRRHGSKVKLFMHLWTEHEKRNRG